MKLRRIAAFRHLDSLEDGWNGLTKGRPIKGKSLFFYDGGRMWSRKRKFRKAHWIITAVLFTDEEIGEPIEVWSGNPDLEKAVMSVIRKVYDLGKAEASITEEVLAQLDENFRRNKKVEIFVSNTMRMRVDVTDISTFENKDI